MLLINVIYKYLKIEPTSNFKSLFSNVIKIVIPMIIGILMSCVLILPTMYAILCGRKGIKGCKSIFDLSILIPHISFENILYSPYSIGLTSIALIALISVFTSKKKGNIVLSAIISVLLVSPIFIYILNGTLYIDSKVFIPFLPLVCIIIANFFKDVFANRSVKKIVFVILSIVSIIGIITFDLEYKILCVAFLIDVITLCIAIIAFCKTAIKKWIYIQLAFLCICCSFISNHTDKLLKIDEAKKAFSIKTDSMINSIIDEDDSFYRFSNEMNKLCTVNKVYSPEYFQSSVYSSVYSKCYNDFYFDIFKNEMTYRNSIITHSTENILFNTLMGNKYIISKQAPSTGYNLVKKEGNTCIYKNDNVFPLGYVTDNLMSERDFDKLEYPYSDEALLNYAIINNNAENNFSTNIENYYVDKNAIEYKNLVYSEKDGDFCIKANENATMTINLKELIKNKILFITFNMNQRSIKNDTAISINGETNKLTAMNWKYKNDNYVFNYVISSNDPISKLDIEFLKGNYQIDGIKIHVLDYDKIKNISKNIDPFLVDMKNTKGDVISGEINATKDGYFVLNIPYDKGFNIKVDNKKVKYERVNKSFIGFEISKENKNIDITYKVPLQSFVIILSLIVTIIAVCLYLYEKFFKEKVEDEKD